MSNNIQNSFTRILLVAVMAMACFAMNAQRLSHTNENKRGTIEQQIANAPINYNNQKVDALLKLAFSFRGTPYVYGASRPGAFDCSGFTSYVFSQFGYSLDRTSRGQVNNGRSVSRSELKPGDLVFSSDNVDPIGHVGMYIGDGQFIHASTGKGQVIITDLDSYYYAEHYTGARRII